MLPSAHDLVLGSLWGDLRAVACGQPSPGAARDPHAMPAGAWLVAELRKMGSEEDINRNFENYMRLPMESWGQRVISRSRGNWNVQRASSGTPGRYCSRPTWASGISNRNSGAPSWF